MTDMTLTQAADEVRKMLRGFRAVEQVAAALDRAGSIENSVRESEAALASVRAQVSAAQAELETKNSEIAAAQNKAKALVAEAEQKAKRVVEVAGEQAESIKAAAKSEADAAAERHSAILRDIDAANIELNGKRESLADIENRLAAARTERDRLLKA